MKEYEIRVTATTIVYVDAEDDNEAKKIAQEEAWTMMSDACEVEIISTVEEKDMDITICGEHGCDGCLLQHAHDIERCKAVGNRLNKTSILEGNDFE